MIIHFAHYSKVQQWGWPHFSPKEMACRHCGELLVYEDLLNMLELQRSYSGKAIIINSAYRCAVWNTLVGGADLSKHRSGTAVDQSLRGKDREAVYMDAIKTGFLGIGWYKTFTHTDLGPRREWGARMI